MLYLRDTINYFHWTEKMKRIILLTLLCSIPFLSMCRPTMNERDEKLIQIRKDEERRTSELEAIEGNYEGKIALVREGYEEPFKLRLTIGYVPYNGDDVADEILIPTLFGTVERLLSSFINDENWVPTDFKSADYNKDTREIRALFENPRGSLKANVEGDTIFGEWAMAGKGVIGHFLVYKMEEE